VANDLFGSADSRVGFKLVSPTQCANSAEVAFRPLNTRVCEKCGKILKCSDAHGHARRSGVAAVMHVRQFANPAHSVVRQNSLSHPKRELASSAFRPVFTRLCERCGKLLSFSVLIHFLIPCPAPLFIAPSPLCASADGQA
jgi:hypothetical protein